MPIDPRMSITTPVTDLLGINHPILLAPMYGQLHLRGAVGLIHDIPSARELIERVVHEASALLTRWSP
jgi:hypothetical protein